jgi:hypothetical protein
VQRLFGAADGTRSDGIEYFWARILDDEPTVRGDRINGAAAEHRKRRSYGQPTWTSSPEVTVVTAPRIVRGIGHDSGVDRVAVDVANECQPIAIRIDESRPVTALEQVTSRGNALLLASGVG